jgi:hypothetical protein
VSRFGKATVLHDYRRLQGYVPALAALILPLSFAIYLLQLHLYGDAGAKVFASYWASGSQLAAGRDPFALTRDVWVFKTKSGLTVEDVNLNSPIFLPICRLFNLLPLRQAAIVWSVLTTGAFLTGIIWMNRVAKVHWAKAAWAFLFLPVWDSLIIGQNYALIFLMALLLWFGIRTNKTMVAAIALGLLVAFKPNFAVVVPILFVAEHRRLSVMAGIAAVIFFALPVLLYGPDLYVNWFAALARDNHWVFTTTVSLPSYFRRLGAGAVGNAIAAIVFLASLAVVWRKRPNVELTMMLGLVVSILVSPLAWFHYLLVLLPFLVSRTWTAATTIGAVALVLLQPTIVLYAMGKGLVIMATLGGAMLLATLFLMAGILLDILRADSTIKARHANA